MDTGCWQKARSLRSLGGIAPSDQKMSLLLNKHACEAGCERGGNTKDVCESKLSMRHATDVKTSKTHQGGVSCAGWFRGVRA